MNMYDALAPFYATLNDTVDYESIAAFLDACFRKHFEGRVESVLDLGCGSGNVTLPLLRRGYDMIGVDISEEMLSEAHARDGEGRVLWLCQDMRSFELYGTVEAVVCTLDGINHLTKKEDVLKCFHLVHNYLVPNGIFVFDVNTEYKFQTVYGKEIYVMEEDGIFCAWQNEYSEKSRLCRFDITLFEENADGTYQRYDASQKERMYPEKILKQMLEEAGFALLEVKDGYTDAAPTEKSERLTLIARAIKA